MLLQYLAQNVAVSKCVHGNIYLFIFRKDL